MIKRKKIPVKIRRVQERDFESIQEMTARVYTSAVPWRADQLASHQEYFPEGQIVAENSENGRILGYAASLIVRWDEYDMGASWRDFTDKGLFTNHDPSGKTLYGAEVMVHPEAQGFGVGTELYRARRELVQDLGLLRIRAGARLASYSSYAEKLTADEYVEKVILGEIRDPTLSFQLRHQFHVLAVVPHYLMNDPKSHGFAAVIEWVNSEVAQPKDYADYAKSPFNSSNIEKGA